MKGNPSELLKFVTDVKLEKNKRGAQTISFSEIFKMLFPDFLNRILGTIIENDIHYYGR